MPDDSTPIEAKHDHDADGFCRFHGYDCGDFEMYLQESASSTDTALTPFDTGERCEAKPWIPYGTEVSEVCPAENFGKVDFDDNEGDTVVVAWVERRPDDTYRLHVEPLVDDKELSVEIHFESAVVNHRLKRISKRGAR
jgi:hypothetical protein